MSYDEIIRLIDLKDKKGWEALYTTYGKKFYGYAVSKWFFNDDESWDIVYQTLETIILKIGEYKIESQEHFDNLLYKILINYLRQHYRKKKSKEEHVQFIPIKEMDIYENIEENEQWNSEKIIVPFDNDFFSGPAEANDNDNVLLNQLCAALNQLEATERDLLLLKANDFTYKEIATMLKIEDKQLKVKHHRAKRKLLKILQTI